jgi:drug/metabolite transporter (DMT)-like permease
MNRGDFLMLFSALGYAMHIIVIDYFSPKTNALRLSHMQFFVSAVFSFVLMFVFESPELYNILISWLPILYAGVLSGAVGFTLQIIAQKDTTPTVTALILSFEAVFAVLTGFVILNEVLSVNEIFGCMLMFAAIVTAQLPEKSGECQLKGEYTNE